MSKEQEFLSVTIIPVIPVPFLAETKGTSKG